METVAESSEYVLLYKPAGIAVESRDITVPDMCHMLMSRYGQLYVINRLDQPAEGLVLFAKNKKAAADLSEQMRSGRIKKEYYCVVHGAPENREGRMRRWLLKDARTNTSKAVPKEVRGAKEACLEYKVLAVKELYDEEYSLISIDLITGRHHQIRVMFSDSGHPLAGDRKYGTAEPEGMNIKSPALCACRLTFTDPESKRTVTFYERPKGEIFGAFEGSYPEI